MLTIVCLGCGPQTGASAAADGGGGLADSAAPSTPDVTAFSGGRSERSGAQSGRGVGAAAGLSQTGTMWM